MKKRLAIPSVNDHEHEYLAELIKDFPPNLKVNVDEALKEIASRYKYLESHAETLFNQKLKSEIPEEVISRFVNKFNIEERTLTLAVIYYIFIKSIHFYLFKDILGNAGEIRKIDDPNSGFVGFGGESKTRFGKLKFQGYPPKKLKYEILKILLVLEPKTESPIGNAIEFYQKFVLLHPFYDVNGRIARLVVSFYLKIHGYHVKWRILNTTKRNIFLKRLNECHKRTGTELYPKYLKYLIDFFSDYVTPISELTGEDNT